MSEPTTEDGSEPIDTRTRVPAGVDEHDPCVKDDPFVTRTRAP
ncbi:hypothetical protein [Halorubrum sp. 48-1-W]|nr:hypothetical protein [Halorubrum sp. 48-1-W]